MRENEEGVRFRISRTKAITSYEILFFLSLTIMLIFVAFRDKQVGTDLNNYLYMMGRIEQMGLARYMSYYSIEPLFSFLELLLIKLFGSNYSFAFIFLTSFCIISFFSTAIYRMSDYKIMSVFLFLSFGFYNQSQNIIRQYIAAGLVLLAISELKKGNHKKYWIISLIAVFIHYTSVVFLIYYFVYKYRKQMLHFSIFTVIFFFLLSIIPIDLLTIIASNTGYGKYLSRDYGGELGVGLIINIFITLLFIVFKDQFEEYDDFYGLWLFMSALTVALNFFLIKFSLVGRFMVYTKIGYLISIPSFIKSFKIDSTKCTIYILAVIFFSIYYIYSIINSDMFNTIPYISQILGINP